MRHCVLARTMIRLLSLLAFTVTTVSACQCTVPGVQCTYNCSPTFCLCDASLHGSLMNTSVGTRCLNGSLVHESQCSRPTHGCDSDGFYCTSPCSVTYSYCVSGILTPKQFVPTGTVCDAGSLVYPNQCISLHTTSMGSCPTYNSSIQCADAGPCSPNFYYCVQYATYAVQMAPTGLKCYNNTFVLASDPICTGPSNNSQTFPILVTTQDWSVLTQYELASTLSTALTRVGTPVQPADIYFASAPVSSASGRRLAVKQLMSIHSSYANLSTALAVAFAENNLAVTLWLPSVSPTQTPGVVYSATNVHAISGVIADSIAIVSCVLIFVAVIVI